MEVSEMNKEFAVFMNIPKCERCEDCGAFQYSAGNIIYPTGMQYHKSYDWLMPVWFKFRDLKKDKEFVKNNFIEFSCKKNIIADSILEKSISEAHKLLYEAITWYNQLNK